MTLAVGAPAVDPPVVDQGFPRSARVRSRAEFDRVFQAGRRTSDPLLSLHWLRDDAPARLGLAVSRKVDPHAVGRNRIKRVLRAQFRQLRTRLPAGAYVIVARSAASTATPLLLRDTFLSLLRRSGALSAPDAGGTMSAAGRTDSLPPTAS